MHSTLFSAMVITVVSRGDTAGRAETNVTERTRNRLQRFHAAVGFCREEFKLFQTVLHAQHQLGDGADPWDQRNSAVFGRRFQQRFGPAPG